jgi:phosphoribosyl 1,2-cyclic phosphodiesterase
MLLLHEGRSLMIDCGKFWWHAALDAFPRHQVLRLDAIVLSHSHNDAAYGLDDLRDLTRLITPPAPPLRVYLRECDHAVVHNAFPYLWGRKDVELAPGGGVPTLQFHLLPMDTQTFEPIEGLQVTPLRVAHGGPDGCWGFRVGSLCYISDAVSIPDDTRALMAGCEVLILDALRWAPEHPSHLTLEQACVEVERLGTQLPRRVWFVGMGHEVDYTQANAFLKARLPNTQAALAHDGLSFDFIL